MPKKYLFISIISLSLLIFFDSCVPPKCRIPNCGILVDHVHKQYGREIAVKRDTPGKKLTGQEVSGKAYLSESPDRWYRGLPWYMFMFRRRYKDPNIAGTYRMIYENEVQRFRKPHQATPNQYAKYRKRQEKAAKKRDKKIERLDAKAEKEEGKLAKAEEKRKKKEAKGEYKEEIAFEDDTEEGRKKKEKKKKDKKKKKNEEESLDEEIEIKD